MSARIEFGREEAKKAPATFDLPTLIDTRLLIQANSGGGKSFLIRKILEVTHGKVQQIVLDLEGEFATLREKYDYLLAGKGGDIPTDTRTAAILARKVLELGTPIIIDLYELRQQDRKLYVKTFLEALVNAPKELWKPVLVVVDEAHQFCPEKEEAESASAVVDLLTRGRKRGQAGILATQRLAKLNKDAAAECNNVLIGRTGLDVDMKRAAEILGFTGKKEMLDLRELDPGEFFAYGPALSREVVRVKVGGVQTSHPKVGSRSLAAAPPPPPEKIRAILSKLADLPAVAQTELRNEADMRREIARLRSEVTQLKHGQTGPDREQVRAIELKAEEKGARTVARSMALAEQRHRTTINRLRRALNVEADELRKAAEIMEKRAAPGPEEKESAPTAGAVTWGHRPPSGGVPPTWTGGESYAQPAAPPAPTLDSAPATDGEEKPLRDGALKMLRVAAQFHPDPVTRTRIATIAGFSERGGTFSTYFGELKRRGWIEERGERVWITAEGLRVAGPVEHIPLDPGSLVDMWAGKFREGAAKMLKYLASKYPEWVEDAELGEQTGFSPSGGTFSTYIGELRRNRVIERVTGRSRASPELFGEDGN